MRSLLALAVSLPLATVLVAPSQGRAEPHARPRDFHCLLKGKKPEGKDFYVFNRNRAKLREAVAMSETGELPAKGYPVGTILQVLPFEAMIKRRPGFNPEGNDWEFVRLTPTANGRTQIRADGKGEVANALGSCQAITYRVWAAQLGLRLDKVEISIDGDIDLRGFFGLDDRVRAGFNAVRIRVSLSGPEHASRYEELAAAVDAHCPVLDLFRNPVPVERNLLNIA